MPNEVRVGRNAESDAVNPALVANPGTGHGIDVDSHSGLDALQLGLTEVGDDPPDAVVDEGEDRSARTCVVTLRNGEVGDARVKRGDNVAIDKVVHGRINGRLRTGKLPFQRLECSYVMGRLLDLLMALIEHSLRLFVLRFRSEQRGLGQIQLRLGLIGGLRARDLQGASLIHLIDGDKLARQKGLDAVQIIRGIFEFSIGSLDYGFGTGNIGFGFFYRGAGAGKARLFAQDVGPGDIHAAGFACNETSLIGDLAF